SPRAACSSAVRSAGKDATIQDEQCRIDANHSPAQSAISSVVDASSATPIVGVEYVSVFCVRRAICHEAVTAVTPTAPAISRTNNSIASCAPLQITLATHVYLAGGINGKCTFNNYL